MIKRSELSLNLRAIVADINIHSIHFHKNLLEIALLGYMNYKNVNWCNSIQTTTTQ